MTGTALNALPVEFADILAAFARPAADGPARVLDATCHQGHVLRRLGTLWECLTFGCDPTDAVQAARLGTTRVIREEFLHTRISARAMSAGIGIVPHTPEALKEGDHVAFARKLVDAVNGPGLIALVVPPTAMDRILFNFVHAHLASLQAYDLGSVGLAAATVFIGVRRWVRSDQKLPRELFREFVSQPLPAFARVESPLTSLPRVDREVQFDPRFLRYDAAAREARTYGVWKDLVFATILSSPSSHTIRPTMPLRKGHLADMVVGGMFDNLLIKRGDRRLLVKGRTIKERTVIREGNRTQEIERFQPVVAIVDLATGEARTLTGRE